MLVLGDADGEPEANALPLSLTDALALPDEPSVPERLPDPERVADGDLDGVTVALRERDGEEDDDMDSVVVSAVDRESVLEVDTHLEAAEEKEGLREGSELYDELTEADVERLRDGLPVTLDDKDGDGDADGDTEGLRVTEGLCESVGDTDAHDDS